MKWSIKKVSIPVFDLKKSESFYEILLGKKNDHEDECQDNFFENESIFFGEKGVGLRLFKLKSNFDLGNSIQSNKTFVTIKVNNLDLVYQRLIKKKIKFKLHENKKCKSLIFQEPSLNLIQLVENFDDEMIDSWYLNKNWKIHHVNLESYNVRKSVDFFREIIEMKEGKWNAPIDMGDFSIDPRKLSIFPLSESNRGLHIIKADYGFGWRNNFPHNPSIGGHPAITVKNISEVMGKLKEKEILYSDAKVYAMPGFHQIYLNDINSNLLEINQAV